MEPVLRRCGILGVQDGHSILMLTPGAPESCVLHGERSVLSPESLKEDGIMMKGVRRRGQGSALQLKCLVRPAYGSLPLNDQFQSHYDHSCH